MTAIGHSYGSLTVGQAAQPPGGIPADDMVLVGSPDSGVDRAADLGVGVAEVTGARGPVRLLGCVLLAVLLTACQGGKEKEEPNMDMQQAGERAEEILDGLMAAIQPSVKWARGLTGETACDKGFSEQTGTTSITRSRNVLTVVSRQRRGELFKMIRGHWEQQGFREFDIDSREDMPRTRAKSPDGLVVILSAGSTGNISVTAGFACARDSPMSYPKGTPSHPGGPVKSERIPREHSPYWSATGAPR
ncbi:hypothetical protein JCM13580A_41610 [Streptomyces drozdowiczii]